MKSLKKIEDKLKILQKLRSGELLIALESWQTIRIDAGIKTLEWVLSDDDDI